MSVRDLIILEHVADLPLDFDLQHYTGMPMAITKAVCDAGQGGMILVSADAVERIFIESLEQKVMVRGWGRRRL